MTVIFMEKETDASLGIYNLGVDVVPNIGEFIILDIEPIKIIYKVVSKTWSFGDTKGIVYELEKLKENK